MCFYLSSMRVAWTFEPVAVKPTQQLDLQTQLNFAQSTKGTAYGTGSSENDCAGQAQVQQSRWPCVEEVAAESVDPQISAQHSHYRQEDQMDQQSVITQFFVHPELISKCPSTSLCRGYPISYPISHFNIHAPRSTLRVPTAKAASQHWYHPSSRTHRRRNHCT